MKTKSGSEGRSGAAASASANGVERVVGVRSSRNFAEARDTNGADLVGLELKIGVVGLGYVGLPLAVAFSQKHEVIGFDVSSSRVAELRRGEDSTNEVPSSELANAKFTVTGDAGELAGCDVFIATVPTPIDNANRPNFEPIRKACELIGPALTDGAIVVFESTVYPGATEEICAPELERTSGLKAGVDFKLGYSPERINPGDKDHPIGKIIKVVAGQDVETLDTLAELYSSIIEAGVHRAPSIKVAEAAKVIENTQRDINIALMNEVSKICDLLDIRSTDVLEAAGTKWNFLKFYPGLVGGHCIGVDPYYLTAKAEALGYHPEVILAGRRVNDSMGSYVGQRIVKMLATFGHRIRDQRVGILGFTFKENVPDIRNSKVLDIYRELKSFAIEPLIHDPRADSDAVRKAHDIQLVPLDELHDLGVLIYAVPHDEYVAMEPTLCERVITDGIVVDIRGKLGRSSLRDDIRYWSL
jgi:UDP-N-acetyl-D-glucosamine/UDP-N-acetyl-D-galactosamine dehydrogenase